MNKNERRNEHTHRYSVFKKLHEECKKEGVYSVIETTQKMGIDYAQVQEWAKNDKNLQYALDMCRLVCECHAENDSMSFKLDYEKSIKYIAENMWEGDERKDAILKELKKIQDREEHEAIEKGIKVSVMIEQNIKENNNQVAEIKSEKSQELQKKLRETEQERIKKWQERKAKEGSRIALEINKEGRAEIINATTPEEESFSCESTLSSAVGSISSDFNRISLSQVQAALHPYGYGASAAMNTSLEVLLSMNPQDEFDGMLCRRLLVLDSHFMQSMMAAAHTQTIEARERHVNMATKLGRLHNETLDTLTKYRRKGEQKVTVTHNHVSVNDGGKAIVTSEINTAGGGGG